jgi:hypothetical protein
MLQLTIFDKAKGKSKTCLYYVCLCPEIDQNLLISLRHMKVVDAFYSKIIIFQQETPYQREHDIGRRHDCPKFERGRFC